MKTGSAECDLGNVVVHYQERGSGMPVVFLHGWTVDHRFEASDYEPVFAHREGWRRLYLDLPGHGRTPAAPWITSMDQMLDVVLAFIEQILPGQRFAMAGTSAGGYLARGVVSRMASRIDGLVLRVPLVEPDKSKLVLPRHSVLVERPDLRATLTPDEESGFGLAVVQSEAFLAKMRADSFPARRLADFGFLDAIGGGPRGFAFTFDVDAMDVPFQAPTLIVVGRQDSVVGYRNACDLLEDYPRATLAVLDREGHILPVEQADLFRSLVENWLDRVEEFREQSAS